MNSTLFVIQKGKPAPSAKGAIAEILKTTKDVTEIGEGAYLLHGDKSLPFLGQLCACAENEDCPYTVIVVRDGFQWGRTF